MEIGNTMAIEKVNQDIILLCLFPFSLVGRANKWFYANKEDINTWVKCSKAFLAKFFLIGKTNDLRGKITNFQQHKKESISEAWERLQGYIQNCPHHRMEEWLLIQGFYHGLNQKMREHLDDTAKGSFLSLRKAKKLMEKISDNQSWSQDKGEEATKEVNALSTKMDDLLHWLDQRAKYKEDQRAIEAIYKQDSSPAVRKVPHQPNWRQHQNGQGMNSGNFTKQPSLRELVMQQSKINLDN